MKFNIKSIVKELAIGLVILFVVSNVLSYIRKPTLESGTLPTQTFRLIDGSRYTPKAGKPLLIHFWATWCKVCSMEASNIEQLSKKYEVLSIAVQSGSNEAIQKHMQKEGLSFAVVNDKDAVWAEQFNVTVFPTDFIYDSQGILSSTDVGYSTTASLLMKMKFGE